MRFSAAIILVFTILLSSCSKKQDSTPEKLLQRKWLSVENQKVDTTRFLVFSSDQVGEKKFRSNYFGSIDTVSGTWKLDGAILLLEKQNQNNIYHKVDSLAYENNNDGSHLNLYLEGEKFISLHDGKLIDSANFIRLQIDSLSSTALVLHTSSDEVIRFQYELHELSSSINLISISRGILGLFVLILIGWLLSEKRNKIDWKLVGIGIFLQLIFALGVLKVPMVETIFEGISGFFISVISFTQEGTQFLFGSFISGKIESPIVNFVVMVLPTVIFFSALTSLLFYWGILQRIVYGLAWIMKKTMRLSGAESMAAAGNVFLGQTEAPLLVKPYLANMTRSEIMCLMSGGMATIAGGVLAAYIGFLGGDDPQEQLYFAKHLLAASVMSAPAAIVAAKLLVPETEEINKEMSIPKEKLGSNALEAVTNGATDGLKLAANVAAMLLVFIALIAMGNYFLSNMIGEWTGLNEIVRTKTNYDSFSLQFIVGYIFSPIAYLIGIPYEDTILVGQLLGEKTILNEFYAYKSLGEMKTAGVFSSEKSIIMSTYILCGFSNFASIGIQIGGIGALAPTKRAMLSQLGFRALIGGTLACLFTAVVVGMLM